MAKIKVLFFDLDDTLVGSSHHYVRALEMTGINPQGKSFLQGREQVKNRLSQNAPSSRSRLLYFKAMLELESKFSSEALLKTIHDYEENLLSLIKEEWEKLNRHQLFKELSKKYKLGIITNETCRMQILKLKMLDPRAEYFGGVITSEEAGVEKPDFKIYQEALRFHQVVPAQVMMVGDSYANDIEPALKLGMQAVLTHEFIRSDGVPSGHYKTIKSLSELLDFL